MAKSKPNTDFLSTLNQFADELKTQPPTAPIQEVRPVEPTPKAKAKSGGGAVGEVHYNLWMDAGLNKRVKVHAAQHGMSMKQIVVEALEAYLKK